MAQEAELTVRARLTGNLKKSIQDTRAALRDLDQRQREAARAAWGAAQATSRAWDSASSSIDRTTGALEGTLGTLTSMKALVAAIGAGLAGGAAYEKLIGSNAQLQSARTTFNVLVGDVRKADQLIGEVRRYAAQTPFSESELIDGSKRLLRLTGQNAEQNLKLLKLAGQMKAISPDKTFADAVEAILDAQGMEFERLKEFGIKLSSEDVKKSKKRGETLGDAALRGFEEALTKQTGGRDVVGALATTFEGRVSTIKDRFTESFRRLGEPAFNVLNKGLGEFEKSLGDIEADPQFKRDFEDVANALASGARSAVELVKQLPQAVAFARALKGEVTGFVEGNAGLLKVAGGAYLANRLTGGGASSALAAGGRRLLFGPGGGAAGPAGPLAAGAGMSDANAIPVRVVNMGSGFPGLPSGAPTPAPVPGLPDFITRNTGGAGFGSTAKAFGSSLASKGAVATLGVGGTAAGGGLLALFGAAAAIQLDVMRRTDRVVKGFEDAEEAERKKRMEQSRSLREQDAARAKADAERRTLTAGTRDYFNAALSPGVRGMEREQGLARALQAAQEALGGSGAKVAGKGGSAAQQAALEALNKDVSALGIKFVFEPGKGGTVGSRLRILSGEAALSANAKEQVAAFRRINDLRDKNPEAFKAVSQSPEFKQLDRQARTIGERITRGQALGGELRGVVRGVEIGRIEINAVGADPTTARVVADQLLGEINKALALAGQQ